MNSILLDKVLTILRGPSKEERAADILDVYDIKSEDFHKEYLVELSNRGFAREGQAVLNALRDIETRRKGRAQV